MKPKNIIAFFCFFFIPAISAATFVQLVSIQIIADELKTILSTSAEECSTFCEEDFECIGFEFVETEPKKECKLLTKIRRLKPDLNACNFFIYDKRANVTGLNGYDEIVYFNAFLNESCPQEFDFQENKCVADILQSQCMEYANFFKATFDSNRTQCIIEHFRPQHFCDPSHLLLHFSQDVGYCYTYAPGNTSKMQIFNDACELNYKCKPASVCSTTENDRLLIFANEQTLNFAVFNGLYFPENKEETVFEWADGNDDCEFRNWEIETFDNKYPNTTETFVQINSESEWEKVDALSDKLRAALCKKPALTFAEYEGSCSSIDNCQQLKVV
uniref:Apple domain-containing protein n=1 Tax=Panagrolaimus sp. ES5 TaxID=591445 RepID=A0AC34GYL7_9BILA